MAGDLADRHDDHYTTRSPERVMPRTAHLLAQPVSLGIAAVIAAAIMATFGWGFSILDGNISELHTEMAGIRQSIDSMADSSHRDSLRTSSRMDSVSSQLNGRIDSVSSQLNGRIDSVSRRLNGRIDSVSGQLNGKIDSVAREIAVTNTKLDYLIDVTRDRKR